MKNRPRPQAQTQSFSSVPGNPMYPPPSSDPLFVKKWNTFIDFIVDRDGFHPAHLDSLEMLCELYVEHEALKDFTTANGMTYTAKTSQGDLFRPRPEAQLLQKVKVSIKDYTQKLDLFPKKDKGTGTPPGNSDWE